MARHFQAPFEDLGWFGNSPKIEKGSFLRSSMFYPLCPPLRLTCYALFGFAVQAHKNHLCNLLLRSGVPHSFSGVGLCYIIY
ncbi:TPA: hypothetical protein DHT42_00415 [Candidatus Nomurabacteria bacterium]|nr:hypothetical protein [Candidatus Nomurabacteria bacterium]